MVALLTQGCDLVLESLGFLLEQVNFVLELGAGSVEPILPTLLAGGEPIALGAELFELPCLCFYASGIAVCEPGSRLLQLDSRVLKFGPQLDAHDERRRPLESLVEPPPRGVGHFPTAPPPARRAEPRSGHADCPTRPHSFRLRGSLAATACCGRIGCADEAEALALDRGRNGRGSAHRNAYRGPACPDARRRILRLARWHLGHDTHRCCDRLPPSVCGSPISASSSHWAGRHSCAGLSQSLIVRSRLAVAKSRPSAENARA